MTAVLLDTCVLVDLLRGNAGALRAVMAEAEQPYYCPVSVMELIAGARSQKQERAIDDLLGSFAFCDTQATAFRHAGELLRHFQASHGIDPPDALIAATAADHGFRLATINVKHFPMLPKLKPFY